MSVSRMDKGMGMARLTLRLISCKWFSASVALAAVCILSDVTALRLQRRVGGLQLAGAVCSQIADETSKFGRAVI